MKKSFFIILSIIISLQMIPIHSQSAPGDSVAEALIATIGENNATMTAYDDYNYYNFTGSKYATYNFTTHYSGPSSYLPMYIYDENQTLIDSNVAGNGPWTLILSGYEKYIIRHYASEFTVTPMDFTLSIYEYIPKGNGTTLSTATLVNLGNTTDTFENYNDEHWYNFTGFSTETYNFMLSHTSDSYGAIYLYSGNMELIASNWTVGDLNLVSSTGYDKYVIVASASEFTVLPMEYTLTIVIPGEGGTNSESTNSMPSGSSSSTSPSENDQDSDGQFPLPLFGGFLGVILPISIMVIYLRFKSINK